MPEIISSTSFELDPPLILDADALKQLDQILIEAGDRLQKRKAEIIEELAQEEFEDRKQRGWYKGWSKKELAQEIDEIKTEPSLLSYELRDDNLSIEVNFRNERYVAQSFDETLTDPQIFDRNPKGFTATLERAGVSCEVSTASYVALKIEVRPQDSSEARRLFGTLKQWALQYQAPLWQRIWVKITGYHWFIWLFLLSISALSIGSSSSIIEDAITARSIEILNNGIDQNNLPEALELLLAFQVDYYPESSSLEPTIPRWFSVLLFGGFALSIMLSITPSVVIGIGRGQRQARVWKWWLRFVGITLPGFIFTSFFLDDIMKWVNRIFGNSF